MIYGYNGALSAGPLSRLNYCNAVIPVPAIGFAAPDDRKGASPVRLFFCLAAVDLMHAQQLPLPLQLSVAA